MNAGICHQVPQRDTSEWLDLSISQVLGLGPRNALARLDDQQRRGRSVGEVA